MSATGLMLALCLGVSLALGQTASAAPDTNPIGKVLVAAGTVRIEHPAAILVHLGRAAAGDEKVVRANRTNSESFNRTACAAN